jgi:hypothetical protein
MPRPHLPRPDGTRAQPGRIPGKGTARCAMTGSASVSSVLSVAERTSPRALTPRVPHVSCLHVSRLPLPPRDLLRTRFGPDFLPSSCPTHATTPAPTTPSAKPGPAQKLFLLSAPRATTSAKRTQSFPSCFPSCLGAFVVAVPSPRELQNEPTARSAILIRVHPRPPAVPTTRVAKRTDHPRPASPPPLHPLSSSPPAATSRATRASARTPGPVRPFKTESRGAQT